MPSERLQSARDYFDNITTPAYQQFKNDRTTFLIVYSMASGLFHLAEWLFFYKEAEVKTKYGQNITSAGALWHQVIEPSVLDAGFVRDLNNAAKHTKLSFNPHKPGKGGPSTTMYYAANTSISTSGWSEGGFSEGPFGGAATAKMDEGGREVLLEPIATAVYDFWKVLIDELDPAPAMTIAITPSVSTANS